jgi:hypothetical protein
MTRLVALLMLSACGCGGVALTSGVPDPVADAGAGDAVAAADAGDAQVADSATDTATAETAAPTYIVCTVTGFEYGQDAGILGAEFGCGPGWGGGLVDGYDSYSLVSTVPGSTATCYPGYWGVYACPVDGGTPCAVVVGSVAVGTGTCTAR